MTKTGPDHLVVIVEEVVQRVYLLDPESEVAREAFAALPSIIREEAFESIPMPHERPSHYLGKRATKGGQLPGMLLKRMNDASRSGTPPHYHRMTTATFILPNEDTGEPDLEIKATRTNLVRKPYRK